MECSGHHIVSGPFYHVCVLESQWSEAAITLLQDLFIMFVF